MSRSRIILLSVGLYLAACFLPAVEFLRNQSQTEHWSGMSFLIIGWIGPLIGQYAWYANPPYWLALILFSFKKDRWCLASVVLALFVALNVSPLFVSDIPADEAGVSKLRGHRLLIGFYSWIGSFLIILLGALFAPKEPTEVVSDGRPGST